MFKNNIVRCLTAVAGVLFLMVVQGPTVIRADDAAVRESKAEIIRLFMNESVDPCEDFYEFGCGNFMARAPPIPGFNFLRKFEREMYDKALEMMSKEDAYDTEVDRKVKMFFNSCMNLEQTNGITRDKLLDAIEEFGTMPVLAGDQWQESRFDWAKTLTQIIHKSALMPIISFDIIPNFNNQTINMVSIGETHLLLGNRVFYVEPSLSGSLNNLVQSIARNLETFLGVDKELALQTATEMKDFEVALAPGMIDTKVISTLSQVLDLLKVDDAQRQYSQYWDVKKAIQEALGLYPDELYVNTAYVKEALKAIANTPKRVVANYLFYIYLKPFFIMPSPPACEMTTIKSFYDILTNMFYRRQLNDETKQTVFQMWRELKKMFGETLKSPSLNWMQQDTRTEAWYKLKATKMRIHAFDDVDFNKKFAELEVNNYDFVHNLKSVLSMFGQQHRAKMYEPRQLGLRDEDLVLSPFNFPNENTVYLTVVPLLDDVLFSKSYPAAYNYATTGATIGHELIHSFDDVGKQYDSHGNKRDWWDVNAAHFFNERKQCFVNQYKQYSYNGIPMPETQLQRENIADSEGLRLAYEAYMDWYNNAKRTNPNVDADAFPDFHYNNEQLFFISFAHSWCTVINSDYLETALGTDTHTIEKFRVNGPLANLEAFSKAFNCPLGSPMNPVNKCKIY